MRKRVNSTVTPTTIYYIDSPGGTSALINTPHGWKGTNRTIDEDVFGNYFRRKKAGDILIGNMVLVKHTRTPPTGDTVIGPHPSWGTRTFKGDLSGYISNIGDPAVSMDPLRSTMSSSTLVRAYAEAKNQTALLGEGVATVGQTVGMLRKPFGAARSLLKKIEESKWRRIKSGLSVPKAFSESWLEYRYGWKPLIGDCIAIITETQGILKRPYGERRVARAFADASQILKGNATFSHPTLYASMGSQRIDRHVGTSSGVIYELLVDSAGGYIAQQYGTRLCDIPSTMWELTPWSFVADWFVGVGDWIRAISPDPCVRYLGSWTTEVDRQRKTHEFGQWSVTISTHPQTTYKGTVPVATEEYLRVQRTANPVLPRYPVKVPHSLSLNQTLDSVALAAGEIYQAIKRMKS